MGRLENQEWVTLVDDAARGDLEAAAKLAEGYAKGSFGKADRNKALKWCRYAAKRGNQRALQLLAKLEK